MIRPFLRLLLLASFASCLTPLVVYMASTPEMPAGFAGHLAQLTALAIAATSAIYYVLRRLEPSLDRNAAEQDAFLASLSDKFTDIAILGSAALSLFLELAIIRWQGTVVEFFAFYKNFGLISCFIGLGLGYALANRGRIPLVLTTPLL